MKRTNLRILYLLLFSLFFYYKSSGWFFLLLLATTGINFFLGHLMHLTQRRLVRFALLWCSIGSSLGVLAYYKYSSLFLGTWELITGQSWTIGALFLPAGISFYTFQTLSYTIDIYRKYLPPLSAGAKTPLDWGKAFMDFAFFISFFPQLVAGPIVRAADFLPQIRKPLSLSREQMGQGMVLIMSGLFKKTVLSDYISVNFVDRVFDAPLLYSGLENLLAAYGYAVQIYCDFSGYSDMAIGLALLMGFWLPENFRTPYLADSIQNFWRRWHISLSSWLRDYLYISLGGSRKGSFRTFLSLMLTMLRAFGMAQAGFT
ncbi:MAG: MBOAT family protein [Haliscomenobacter sp.]|nr:MBOAT family protein [Haliscomenobacter sp.]